ncbi:hypothetical protein [Pasteurella multocida]|uniref:hypothetical protein n=1 Tax=Pasteurella multocida TaxID=747 RepID=UPI002300B5DC|nr:hypothetical protein [Pasteurella multocida]MDA5608960.1 hypothetical protein [Pasteurella multocida subsp. multocida]MDA5616481.1 hypothetical protein [Pasteurella multocida]MDA5626500.1 hypothetical protein [Pasteurella multocida]
MKMGEAFKIRALVKCPLCEGALSVSNSKSESLILFNGDLVCCNPRCRKFECKFTLYLHDFKTFGEAKETPEIATWTKSLKQQKLVDERQLEILTD